MRLLLTAGMMLMLTLSWYSPKSTGFRWRAVAMRFLVAPLDILLWEGLDCVRKLPPDQGVVSHAVVWYVPTGSEERMTSNFPERLVSSPRKARAWLCMRRPVLLWPCDEPRCCLCVCKADSCSGAKNLSWLAVSSSSGGSARFCFDVEAMRLRRLATLQLEDHHWQYIGTTPILAEASG